MGPFVVAIGLESELGVGYRCKLRVLGISVDKVWGGWYSMVFCGILWYSVVFCGILWWYSMDFGLSLVVGKGDLRCRIFAIRV